MQVSTHQALFQNLHFPILSLLAYCLRLWGTILMFVMLWKIVLLLHIYGKSHHDISDTCFLKRTRTVISDIWVGRFRYCHKHHFNIFITVIMQYQHIMKQNSLYSLCNWQNGPSLYPSNFSQAYIAIFSHDIIDSTNFRTMYISSRKLPSHVYKFKVQRLHVFQF